MSCCQTHTTSKRCGSPVRADFRFCLNGCNAPRPSDARIICITLRCSRVGSRHHSGCPLLQVQDGFFYQVEGKVCVAVPAHPCCCLCVAACIPGMKCTLSLVLYYGCFPYYGLQRVGRLADAVGGEG